MYLPAVVGVPPNRSSPFARVAFMPSGTPFALTDFATEPFASGGTSVAMLNMLPAVSCCMSSRPRSMFAVLTTLSSASSTTNRITTVRLKPPLFLATNVV